MARWTPKDYNAFYREAPDYQMLATSIQKMGWHQAWDAEELSYAFYAETDAHSSFTSLCFCCATLQTDMIAPEWWETGYEEARKLSKSLNGDGPYGKSADYYATDFMAYIYGENDLSNADLLEDFQ